jgi:hypothetical protein
MVHWNSGEVGGEYVLFEWDRYLMISLEMWQETLDMELCGDGLSKWWLLPSVLLD